MIYHLFQASFTSEESAARESPAVDSLSQQRIQHLEQSIADYKSENSRLQRTLDAAEADNAIGGPKRTRKDLVQEIDAQKAAADEATKGIFNRSICISFPQCHTYRSARSAKRSDTAERQYRDTRTNTV